MKYLILLILGVALGAFLTVQVGPPVTRLAKQAQGTVNRTSAQINHTSNQVSAKVGEVKKVLTK